MLHRYATKIANDSDLTDIQIVRQPNISIYIRTTVHTHIILSDLIKKGHDHTVTSVQHNIHMATFREDGIFGFLYNISDYSLYWLQLDISIVRGEKFFFKKNQDISIFRCYMVKFLASTWSKYM